MVKGVGVDLVEIKRFQEKHDLNDFLGQILNSRELDRVKENPLKFLPGARMFAVKEAILKALECGLHPGTYWHNIETTENSAANLSGFLGNLAREKSISKVHLSHSCSKRFSVAVVILEE